MNGPALLALQTIDTALDGIEHRRKRLPEASEHARAVAELTSLRAQLKGIKAMATEAEAAIEAAEHEAGSLTSKRERLEAQLKTVIAPREAEALMHEIALLTSKRAEQDDVELAAMDQLAEAESATHAVNEQVARAEQAVSAATAALAQANDGLDVERDALVSQRPAAAAALTEAEATTYARMRTQFGGVAVAKLEGLRCTGCHLDLSRGEVDAVKTLPADEVGECPQCNRLLVR